MGWELELFGVLYAGTLALLFLLWLAYVFVTKLVRYVIKRRSIKGACMPSVSGATQRIRNGATKPRRKRYKCRWNKDGVCLFKGTCEYKTGDRVSACFEKEVDR